MEKFIKNSSQYRSFKCFFILTAFDEEAEATVNSGNTACMLIATSWVVLMTSVSRFVDVSRALAIGLISRLVGYCGVIYLKSWVKHDDTLDAFGIHGLVGIAGAILIGVFANPEINGGAGLLYGNAAQVWV